MRFGLVIFRGGRRQRGGVAIEDSGALVIGVRVGGG